jgi:copper chaperone CopZ
MPAPEFHARNRFGFNGDIFLCGLATQRPARRMREKEISGPCILPGLIKLIPICFRPRPGRCFPMEPRREDIARLAYQFYLEDGRVAGREADHWARAEEFLRHPENHSDSNVLAPPSEPELTPALDEKALELDRDLPSNPLTGEEAVHQHMEIATDPREPKKNAGSLRQALRGLPGIEKVDVEDSSGRIQIRFDARRTNPAAIHEAILARGYKPSEVVRS